MADRRSNGSVPKKRNLRARMMPAMWVFAAQAELPRCRPQTYSSFPPQYDIVEIPATVLRNQRYDCAAGGDPNLPALFSGALTFSILVIVDQLDQLRDAGQHRQARQPVASDGRPGGGQRPAAV